MKSLSFFIEKYLSSRPLFFSIIRSQEGYLFSKYAKLIPPTLDLGCGDGFFVRQVFGEGHIDIGFDLENSRINEAKKNNVYKKMLIGKKNTIPLPDDEVNTVISNCVLEHIPDLPQSLNEIYRILKKGGTFYTSVMGDKWEDYLIGSKIFGNYYKKFMRKRQEHYNLWPSKKWRAEFERAGFTVTQEIGYLSPQDSAWMDLLHYVSYPSLVSYKLLGTWVPLPIFNQIWNKIINKIVTTPPYDVKKAAAYFYILKKN